MALFSIILGGDLTGDEFNESHVPAYSRAVKEVLRSHGLGTWVETRVKCSHMELVVEVPASPDNTDLDWVQETLAPAVMEVIDAGRNILAPGLWGMVCSTDAVASVADLIEFNNDIFAIRPDTSIDECEFLSEDDSTPKFLQ